MEEIKKRVNLTTKCASELVSTYMFYNLISFDMHIMKNSMHSPSDTKTVKQVYIFSSNFDAWPGNMEFPSLSSTQTKILFDCTSHFIQEHKYKCNSLQPHRGASYKDKALAIVF